MNVDRRVVAWGWGVNRTGVGDESTVRSRTDLLTQWTDFPVVVLVPIRFSLVPPLPVSFACCLHPFHLLISDCGKFVVVDAEKPDIHQNRRPDNVSLIKLKFNVQAQASGLRPSSFKPRGGFPLLNCPAPTNGEDQRPRFDE